MFAATVFVYGLGVISLASLLGTAISLAATGIIVVIFVNAAHITGTSGEEGELIFGTGWPNRVDLGCRLAWAAPVWFRLAEPGRHASA